MDADSPVAPLRRGFLLLALVFIGLCIVILCRRFPGHYGKYAAAGRLPLFQEFVERTSGYGRTLASLSCERADKVGLAEFIC